MQAAKISSGLIILIAVVFTCDARVVGLCRNRDNCMDKCDECIWGSSWTEECGFEECHKGPGQRCGGRHNMWGICGEGLLCQCNKCHGCSTTAVGEDCYQSPCIPHKFFQQPGDFFFLNV